jgi:hypothetical protein
MAIVLFEFNGVKYSGYRDVAEKNKDVNRHSLEINAGKAHVKQGGNEINFRYKGHAVRVVYREKNSAVWPGAVDNYTIPIKKAVEKTKAFKRPGVLVTDLQPLDQSIAAFETIRSEVRELQKAQIRTAARLKKLENESFALRKAMAEMACE